MDRRNRIPALYQPITLLWAFSRARRGEPRLVSWPETQRQVKALLNNYGRDWEGDRVFYPIAALHNAGLWELDADPEQVQLGLSGSEVTSLLEMSFAARAAEYQRLCERADVFWRDRDTTRATRITPPRQRAVSRWL